MGKSGSTARLTCVWVLLRVCGSLQLILPYFSLKKKKKSSADEYPYVRALKCAVAPSRLPVAATSCEPFHLSSRVLSILMCPSSPFHLLCFFVCLVVSPDASRGPNFQLQRVDNSRAFTCLCLCRACARVSVKV